jgi:hypothetical protein
MKFKMVVKQKNRPTSQWITWLGPRMWDTAAPRSAPQGDLPVKLPIFKGTISPYYICLKVVWFTRPRLGHVTLDI